MNPKVSVLIPTYNYGRFLAEAIDSVLAQDFRDFELLIVDDCSTDNTAAVVEPYCKRDPRVKFSVNSPNLGMVENWNHCLKQARGEYIKFLFGDDRLCRPDALGKLLSLLESNPSAILAASARVILDDQSRVLDIWRPLPEGCHDGREIIQAYLMENGKNLVGEPSAVMFRKSDAACGFNPQYRQMVDVEMWFHLLEKGDLAYTREPLCAFRCHDRQQGESNIATGVGPREHARFLSEYAVRAHLSRDVVFPLLFDLRRKLAKNPDPEFLAASERLIERAGPAWRWDYSLYALRYRLRKPFLNLGHALEKRAFRGRFRPFPDCSS